LEGFIGFGGKWSELGKLGCLGFVEKDGVYFDHRFCPSP
jgi:hypothetical protein